jgi:hypothetical protein
LQITYELLFDHFQLSDFFLSLLLCANLLRCDWFVVVWGVSVVRVFIRVHLLNWFVLDVVIFRGLPNFLILLRHLLVIELFIGRF